MTQPADKSTKKSATNEWVETFVVIIEALLIAIVLRFFLFQPFSIPTASMQQTLMIGDYFVANKYVEALGQFARSPNQKLLILHGGRLRPRHSGDLRALCRGPDARPETNR